MTKRDRQQVWNILLKRDCDSPDLTLRDIEAIVDRAVERRVRPLKETIVNQKREIDYLVHG